MSRSTWRVRGKITAGLVCSVLLPALLVGCSSGGGPSPSGSNNARPTLVISTPFTITNLDPYNNSGGKVSSEFGFGELLMRPNPDGTLSPWVLQSLHATSPTVWQLTIRPHIKFQDGKALDGAALAACMSQQLTKNLGIASVLAGATAIASGTLSVTLTTANPVSDLPYLLADIHYFKVFDVDAYNAAAGNTVAGKVNTLVGKGIYTGPYEVQSLTADQMVMTHNNGYWGGKPALSKVTVQFIEDPQAQLLAVENGETDFALQPPASAVKVLAGQSDAYYVTGPTSGGIGMSRVILNVHSGDVFTDQMVREAFSLGINYSQIANEVLNGAYSVGFGMYSSGAPYAMHTQVYDPAKAQQILDQDGWTVGTGGVRSKDGRQLSIKLLTFPEVADYAPVAVAIQAELKSLGFAVTITSVEDINSALMVPTGWDAALYQSGTLATSLDPISALHDDLTPAGQFDFGGVNDAALNSVVASLTATMDPTQTDSLLMQAQQIVSNEAYQVFIGEDKPAVIAAPAWKGYIPSSTLIYITNTTAPTG